MVGTDEHALVDSTEDEDDEATQAAVRQHGMQDSSGPQREADSEVDPEGVIAGTLTEHVRENDDCADLLRSPGAVDAMNVLEVFLRRQRNSINGVTSEPTIGIIPERDNRPGVLVRNWSKKVSYPFRSRGDRPQAHEGIIPRSDHHNSVPSRGLASHLKALKRHSKSSSDRAPLSNLDDLKSEPTGATHGDSHDLSLIQREGPSRSVETQRQKHDQHIGFSDSDRSMRSLEQESLPSLGRPVGGPDDLKNYFLDLQVSKLRSWLFLQSNSGHFFHHLQRQVTYRQQNSSPPQDQSANSSSQPASAPSSSTHSTLPPVSLGGAPKRSKRRRDDTGEDDEQQKRERRAPHEKSKPASKPRLACFYNKFDPLTYRSSAQTGKKFEICETHDFEDMDKLFGHLRRNHSGQSVQCPRCTRTDFSTPEELLAHQMASEPCVWVPPTVKRFQWISDAQRDELRKKVTRELRGRSDEEKWKFTYKRLFRVSDDDVPSPFFQDPVISVVSIVVDHFETRLRSEIRQSNDLSDLERRIPTIFGQVLARSGISVNAMAESPSQDHTNTLPSSSGNLNPSPEDSSALVAPQASFENDYWPQHSTIPYFGDLFPIGSEQDSRSIENTLTDFTEFEMHPVGGTSASYSYGIL